MVIMRGLGTFWLAGDHFQDQYDFLIPRLSFLKILLKFFKITILSRGLLLKIRRNFLIAYFFIFCADPLKNQDFAESSFTDQDFGLTF